MKAVCLMQNLFAIVAGRNAILATNQGVQAIGSLIA